MSFCESTCPAKTFFRENRWKSIEGRARRTCLFRPARTIQLARQTGIFHAVHRHSMAGDQTASRPVPDRHDGRNKAIYQAFLQKRSFSGSDKEDSESMKKYTLPVLSVLLIATMVCMLFTGRFNELTPAALYDLIRSLVLDCPLSPLQEKQFITLSYIRLPRILAAILVGAALAVSGTCYQSLFMNPLVSPGILGVLAGASFGAGIGIVFSTIPSSLPRFSLFSSPVVRSDSPCSFPFFSAGVHY